MFLLKKLIELLQIHMMIKKSIDLTETYDMEQGKIQQVKKKRLNVTM